jgi:hypothetical protein
VNLRMTNTVVDILSIIDRMYDRYNNHEGTRKTLYVKLHKALYGTLRKALLLYKKISQQLQEWRFKINSYDSCIYNKQIDEYQCTVVWHIDNLKISHVENKVVSNIVSQLEEAFAKESPLTTTSGREHEYLGMLLDSKEK